MIKKLVLVFIALVVIQSYAQEGTASPYSFYGIGSLKFKGTAENRSMGGLGIYKDSIHINLNNPATYAGNSLAIYNNESRPVKFTVGGNYTKTKLTSDSGSNSVNNSNIDYIALSVPIGKFGFGFGLMPYTSVGYKLENNNDLGNLKSRFRGEGGINKTFASLAYQFTKGLSAGVDVQYNFGNITNSNIEFLYNNEDELLQSQSRETNTSNLNGFSYNLGVHYQGYITDKLELQAGFTFAPEANLKSDNDRVFSSIIVNSAGQEFELNSITADLVASGLQQTDLTLPSKFTSGLGVGQPRKWFVGYEYTRMNTSEFSNPLYDNTGVDYEDASNLAFGGFYIPKYNSYTSYFSRVVYRAGIRFEKTGLKINNESIKEFGMSFGVGLPAGSTFLSNANIGLELGNRGTTNANLIKENFVRLQISLSLNDRWFKRRKYD
jgi:hypothetical protein